MKFKKRVFSLLILAIIISASVILTGCKKKVAPGFDAKYQPTSKFKVLPADNTETK